MIATGLEVLKKYPQFIVYRTELDAITGKLNKIPRAPTPVSFQSSSTTSPPIVAIRLSETLREEGSEVFSTFHAILLWGAAGLVDSVREM